MASKFLPKVHPLKHWDHDQGLRMILCLFLCLSFCFVFVVAWDLPARCEGAFVMKTIMPFTFGRQPIGLLESRQRSSLKIISKLFCVGLISNFPKAQNPEQLAQSPILISLYEQKTCISASRPASGESLFPSERGLSLIIVINWNILWTFWTKFEILFQPCRFPLSCSGRDGSHSHVHRCGTSQRAGWAFRQSHQTQTCATWSWPSFG